MSGLNRRSFVKAAGAAGAGAAMSGTASAFETISDGLDTDAGTQGAIVVLGDTDDQSLLDAFDLEGRFDYEVLPMSWVKLSGDQIETLAADDRVRYVSDTYELEYYNDEKSREAMASLAANEAGFTGEDIDVAVIDSGCDAAHPDLRDHVETNYVYVDDLLGPRDAMWKDVGTSDPDRVGHGTHCCGIVAGDGTASGAGASTQQKTYKGMAPDCRLSSYAVGATVYLPYAVGAWDHMLRRKRSPMVDFDPVVCSNSYGVKRENRYNPLDPLNVATWEAFNVGVLPVFAAGNDGPSEGTLSRYPKAPHVLGVAAAAGTPDDKSVTGFSSRGRSVGDKGADLPGDGRVTEEHHDRQELLGNLEDYHQALSEGKVEQTSATMEGTLGPAVNAAGYANAAGEKQAHVVDLPEDADTLEGFLDVTPDGQQVTVSFYENYGDSDQELLARMGEEPVYIHHEMALDVPGGETITVVFESENGPQIQYDFEYTVYRTVDLDGGRVNLDEEFRPLTLYRPGITTHGQAVMSTVNKYDVVGALGPLYGSGAEEPIYGPLSGTSMACPGAAGIAALVVEAGTDDTDGAGLEYVGYGSERAGDDDTFTPLDVMLAMEATAEDARKDYTPANAGPGYVNAKAAVDLAKAGTFADFDDVNLVDPSVPQPDSALTASGSRSDDGSVFTQGQTNKIELSLTSADLTNDDGDQRLTPDVEDTVPSGWKVLESFGGEFTRTTNDDGSTTVRFTDVVENETVTYFVEATGSSGSYSFGPATAITDASIKGSKESEFGGTDTNYIVGQSSNF